MLTRVKRVNGGLGWLAATERPDVAAPHSIIPYGYDRKSPQLTSEVNAAVKQCHAVSHRHHDLAHSFCRAALGDVHRFRFRHRRATEISTRMVGMRYQQVLQSRTHSPSECTSLAEPQPHTQSGQSAIGGNMCGKFSCGGGDVDQSCVGIDDQERLRHPHAATVESTS